MTTTPLADVIQQLNAPAVRAAKDRWVNGGSELEVWLTRFADKLLKANTYQGSGRRDALLTLRLLDLQGEALPERFDPLLSSATCYLRCAEEASLLLPHLLELLARLPEPRRAPLFELLEQRATFAILVGPSPWPLDLLRELEPGASARLRRALDDRTDPAALQLTDPTALPHSRYDLHLLANGAPIQTLLPRVAACQLIAALLHLGALPDGIPEVCDPLIRHELGVAAHGGLNRWIEHQDPFEPILRALPSARRTRILTRTEEIPWRWLHLGADDPAIRRYTAQRLGERTASSSLELARSTVEQLGPAILPDLLGALRAAPSSAALLLLLCTIEPLAPHLTAAEALKLLPALDEPAATLLAHLLMRGPVEPAQAALLQAWGDAAPPRRAQLAGILRALNLLHPLPESTLTDLLRPLPPDDPAAPHLRAALEAASVPQPDRARALLPALNGRSHIADPATLALLDALQQQLNRPVQTRDNTAAPLLLARLAAHPDAPFLAWLDVLIGEIVTGGWGQTRSRKLDPAERAALLQRYVDALGVPRMVQATRHLLEVAEASHLTSLQEPYLWLHAQGGCDLHLHLRMLASSSLTLQTAATSALVEAPDGALPGILALLSDSSAAVRAAAARTLERLASPESLAPLREACKKERSKKTKEAMQLAIDAVDPRREHPLDHAADLGAWSLADLASPDAQHLLAQLRDLLYQPPTEPLRLQAFDLLLRLHLTGSAHIAVSYLLTHAQQHWPEDLRVIPWGFDAFDAFKPLLGTFTDSPGTHGPTTTVAFLQTPEWTQHAPSLLKNTEASFRSRKLSPDDAAPFLQATFAGWRFCQEHHLPLTSLDVRVDGGSVATSVFSAASATALDLVSGFGVRISRQPVRRTEQIEGPGLRILRVAVPPRHALRDLHAMKPRQRLLDLNLNDLTAEPDA